MVAVFNERSTNNSQADGFEKNGADVLCYDYRKRAKDIGARNRDREIVQICSRERPDLVFFSKCNLVNSRVVKKCNRWSKTVLWYMDPLNSNFDKELVRKIKYASFTCCALQEPFFEARKLVAERAYFVHEGYDHTADYPIDSDYHHDISFIGELRGERQKYYDEIGFELITDAYGIDHSRAVGESRINLNFTDGGTSDRTYKVLASEGFLLTQPWPEMERDFVDGQDLVTFQGIRDLRSKIDYYLSHDDERKAIAEHGYNTVQKFSRIQFARRVLEIASNIDVKG